ncbi:MAG: S9 family peptidase [Burkholderiaceae bacterium]|nr:S9 family peptidase [Burkholderiaceae bacterium]
MSRNQWRALRWAGLSAAALAITPVLGQTAASAEVMPLQAPTVEQLAQHPRMTGFRLSPDGKHIIAIESQGDVRNILVWQTDKLSAKPQVIGASNMRIQSASFLKNDMLAVTLMQPYDARLDGVLTKTFINKLLVTDLAGKTWKEPLEAANITRSDDYKRLAALALPTIKSRMPRDPDNVIVESDGLGRERDLFRYNLRTGEAARILRLSEHDQDVLVDAAGRPRAKTRSGSDSKGFYIATDLRNAASGQWEEHFRSYVKDRDVVDIVGLGTTPNTVVLRSNVGREVAALFEYDVQARAIKSTLFEHKFFESTGTRLLSGDDPDEANSFDGFSYHGVYGIETHWAHPRHAAVVKGVAQYLRIPEVAQPLVDVASGKRVEVPAFDGVSIAITGFHAGETPTYLVRVAGLNYPAEHYMLRGQRLTLLAKEHPQLDRRALGKSSLAYYKARDGLNIPAILTVPNPALCGPGPYAAVVHPHGGPWARDDMDFDSSGWVPLLVSRCRVVLQPQYRGSAEWGRTLWMSGDAQWGQKMQDDKDDGVQWLVSEKLADPKRVAMFGFSYGGYAAFAAAVRPNGHYKCAIAGAGVSDIERIWAKFYTNPYFREGQEPTVKGLSPLTQADKIKIPIMVYHGERDQIVPLIQSELFVEKARKSDQAVEYHMLQDYAHGPAWTRDIMARQLRIIDQYLAKGCGGSGL